MGPAGSLSAPGRPRQGHSGPRGPRSACKRAPMGPRRERARRPFRRDLTRHRATHSPLLRPRIDRDFSARRHACGRFAGNQGRRVCHRIAPSPVQARRPYRRRVQAASGSRARGDRRRSRTRAHRSPGRTEHHAAGPRAAEEDFGIAPLEAQARGTPVLAYGRGGALETIRGLDSKEPGGVLFAEQTPEAIAAAVRLYEINAHRITASACRENAARFSAHRFRSEFAAFVAARQAEFADHGCAS